MNDIARLNRAIRMSTVVGVLTLAFVAIGIVFRVASGDPTPSAVMLAGWTMIGLLQLLGAWGLRRDRDDPAGIEGRSRQAESLVVAVGVGLPLVALLAVLGILVFALVR